jgi:hypothetical protein
VRLSEKFLPGLAAEFLQQLPDMALMIVDVEALDHLLKIDAPPANDAVACRVRPGVHDRSQFGLLRR